MSTANLALLPSNDAPGPAYRPYITQSVQGHLNQSGVSLTPKPKSHDQSNPPPPPPPPPPPHPKCTIADFTIRVINPECKRDGKNFVLKDIELETFGTVKSLREEILGENVVSFQLDLVLAT